MYVRVGVCGCARKAGGSLKIERATSREREEESVTNIQMKRETEKNKRQTDKE